MVEGNSQGWFPVALEVADVVDPSNVGLSVKQTPGVGARGVVEGLMTPVEMERI